MPGPPPLWPSVQVGSLKAYVDQELGNGVQLQTHAAHLSILADAFGDGTNRYFEAHTEHGEYPYSLLYLRRFVLGPKHSNLKGLLRGANRGRTRKLSWAMLDRVDRATIGFVDDLGSKLQSSGPNIVCFSLSYDQVYGSLYCAKLLETRFPEKKFLFVYGGFRAGDPNTAAVMKAVGASGLLVRGEGERKLVGIFTDALTLEKTTNARDLTPELMADRLARPAVGVHRIQEPFDFSVKHESIVDSQVQDLETLPIPDYSEYFLTAREYMRDQAEFDTWRLTTPITLEGSRGCFGRCDFCNFPLGWGGFRSHSKSTVFARAHEALQRYGSQRVMFADDASDTWAEAYADEVIRQGLSFDAFLETRAHHAEDYWIKLALSGASMLQIGVESLVTRLLSAMKKDTKAIQNLVAQKCLTEMGIHSGSNLITHHPRSTLDDIVETKRVLGYLGHFERFELSHFVLMAGSPLFAQLSEAERNELDRDGPSRLPAALRHYETALAYASPESLGPSREVYRAWDRFRVWFLRPRPVTRLVQVRLGKSDLVITRTGREELESHRFQGADARVYDACHAGLQLEKIVQQTGLAVPLVEELLGRAIDNKLMLKVDDFYLSLALRPRDELVNRIMQKRIGTSADSSNRPAASSALAQPHHLKLLTSGARSAAG
jgi:radical SAM superfamily enzyme YgiQ (UPF0313 family)